MKTKIVDQLIILPILLVMISCGGKKQLDNLSYGEWMKKNATSLLVEKEFGAYKIGLEYQPIDYMLLRDYKDNWTIEDLSFAREERKGLQYFVMHLGSSKGNENLLRTNIQSEEEYYARLEYYNSIAHQDISLIDGNDTLPCVMYHYERYYNAAPFDKLLLAFENTLEHSSDKVLVYNDQVLGLGPVQLRMPLEVIKNIPELIIKH